MSRKISCFLIILDFIPCSGRSSDRWFMCDGIKSNVRSLEEIFVEIAEYFGGEYDVEVKVAVGKLE